MVLNDQSLSESMSALIWNTALVQKYYKPFALLRKEDDVSILLLLLENLSKVHFDLRTNDSALDDPEYWTMVNVFPAGRKPGAMAQAPKKEGSFFSIFSSETPSNTPSSSSSSSSPSSSSSSSSSSPTPAAVVATTAVVKEEKKKKEKKEKKKEEVYFDEIPQDEPPQEELGFPLSSF